MSLPDQIRQSSSKAETYTAHIRLTPPQLARVDALVDIGSFINRTEAIRSFVREGLEREEAWLRGAR